NSSRRWFTTSAWAATGPGRARKTSRNGHPPSVPNLNHFKTVVTCVTTTCLGNRHMTALDRARVLVHWLEVVLDCKTLGNYSSLHAIMSALQSTWVLWMKSHGRKFPASGLSSTGFSAEVTCDLDAGHQGRVEAGSLQDARLGLDLHFHQGPLHKISVQLDLLYPGLASKLLAAMTEEDAAGQSGFPHWTGLQLTCSASGHLGHGGI
ncbi:Ral guanine nucleotide dissociation stimulator, partial [Galemys pyrenaicus]